MATVQVRTNKDGIVSYAAKIRMKGHPHAYATFERKTDANKWIQETESAIRHGKYFKTAEAKKHSFGEMIDRYIKEVLPGKSTSLKHTSNQKVQLLWWKKQLGSYMLADITRPRIIEQRDKLLSENTKRKDKRSGATVNRYLAALSHCYTIASTDWEWVETNPLKKVKSKESKGRVRYLNSDEKDVLLMACRESKNETLHLIVLLALSTGARQMELLNLTWGRINFSKKTILLEETKNGERRILLLEGEALELLQEYAKIRRIDTDLVFPSKDGKKPMSIREAWNSALRRSGVEEFRFHDLRHTFASYLAMEGVSLLAIAELLGHKTLAMVKRYAHLSNEHIP